MNLTGLEFDILGPPLLAGILVILTHVPLGREVLARGIIFIDLAVAQIAGLGVIAAYAMGWDPEGWGIQAAAGVSALLGALFLYGTERLWPGVQEALIGVVFVLAATGGLLLLAGNPHGAEHLKDLLTGQILWVGLGQVGPVALLYAAVLALWFGLRGMRLRFYVLFAVALTASVQLVGVYLVFASLIVPALTVRGLPPGRALAVGYAHGIAAYGLGLALSMVFDLPSGPLVVWMLAVLGVAIRRLWFWGAAEGAAPRTAAALPVDSAEVP